MTRTPDSGFSNLILPWIDAVTSQRSKRQSEWLTLTLTNWLVSVNLLGAVAGVVGIEGGVVSGVFNLESSGVEAPDWRPRHDEQYHEA
jgi:hypothetical protein